MNVYWDKFKVYALAVILICVPKKSIHPLLRYEFFKIPPLKTALLKRRVKRPSVFINCLNGFLVVRITITNHHINSTIDFFILCAKNQKKRRQTPKYNLITFRRFCYFVYLHSYFDVFYTFSFSVYFKPMWFMYK